MTADAHPQKRADIQGLRGIAVLAVVLFHISHAALPGGFAGVDIFFVISGYLITQILLRDMEAGAFRLRDFYQRRVRRLFPALFAVLAFTLVAGLIILPPKLLSELVYSQFFTTLFLSNFAFARLADYFDASASLKPLLHTWSLGVEEQFYLVFPLLLLALRRFARRFLWGIIAGLAVVSLVAAQITIRPEAAFYLPTTRAFELLIGALTVWAQGRFILGDKIKRLLSVLGIFLLVASLIFLNDLVPFPGLWALPPCLGAALLLLTADGWGNKLISAPPLVWTGDLSYSLYLWHWPLLVFARLVFGEALWIMLPVVILAFVFAVLSRRYIEQPFLEKRPRHVWLLAGGVMALSIVSALLVFGARGLPQRFNAAERAAFAAADDFSPDRKRCHIAQNARRDYRDTCVLGGHAPSVAVWGDSEGVELAKALADQGEGVRQITASACPPSVDYTIAYNRACRDHNADMLLHLKSDPNIRTVILAVNYRRYDAENSAAMMGGLELSALDLQAASKQVVLLYPLPVYDFDPPSQVGLALRLGRDPLKVGMSRAQFDRENGRTIAALDEFARAHNLTVVRPSDVLCDAQRCRVYDLAAGVLYFNGQHLGMKGASLMIPAFRNH
ncbi:acyltransferase family protein [Asticcacaulis taihuensis]|uniref:acyltransferase family protein n=1 Tax=Asticcacaulis taihuensis TaxID=260084 RepID=UPI003F690F1C